MHCQNVDGVAFPVCVRHIHHQMVVVMVIVFVLIFTANIYLMNCH